MWYIYGVGTQFSLKLEILIKNKAKGNLFLSTLWCMPSNTNICTGRGFYATQICQLEQNRGCLDSRSNTVWKLKGKSSCYNVYIFSRIKLKLHLFRHSFLPGLDFAACYLLPGLVLRDALWAKVMSGRTIWVTTPGKELGPAEVLAEAKGIWDG